MIIGISGKIGSGKDLIGRIIQFLVAQYELHGQVYDQFDPEENNYRYIAHWEIKKFAGKLKQMVSMMTGIPVEDLEKQEVKDSFLGPDWNKVVMEPIPGKRQDGFIARKEQPVIKKMTVRELLQKLGTDAVRNNVHPNAWVNALMVDYKGVPATILHDDCPVNRSGAKGLVEITEEAEALHSHVGLLYPNWIITDCRFPNEAKAIEERGGILIRVERPDRRRALCPDCGKTEREQADGCHEAFCYKGRPQHASETALDNYPFKHTIYNNGTIEELIEKVRTILIEEKII